MSVSLTSREWNAFGEARNQFWESGLYGKRTPSLPEGVYHPLMGGRGLAGVGWLGQESGSFAAWASSNAGLILLLIALGFWIFKYPGRGR